jgi:DNA-binding transcriptional ArsR family regulator
MFVMTVATMTSLMRTLADPTRRAVFERIATGGEVTAGDLVRGSAVSQPAVSQHLRALREAGLVSERRAGRHVLYRTEPVALAPLIDWIGLYGAFWRTHFDKLETLLKDMD